MTAMAVGRDRAEERRRRVGDMADQRLRTGQARWHNAPGRPQLS